MKWFNKSKSVTTPAPAQEPVLQVKMQYDTDPTNQTQTCFAIPRPLPGVVPDGAMMAFDSAMESTYSQINSQSTFTEGQMFLGFAYLAELSQRNEYRKLTEVIAREMTRCWMKVISTGDNNVSDRIQFIEKKLKDLHVKDRFREATEHDGYFGRGQIYIDTGDNKDLNELKLPLLLSKNKIKSSGIKRLTIVEPTWTYPGTYNSSDPLEPDYFKPNTWFVMGKEVHDSRFLMFTARPVATILKPAYTFCGLSISQIAKPYVDNWLNVRQSVTELIQSFSTTGLKTNLSSVLSGGGLSGMQNRAVLFNRERNNKGLMIIDKDSEDFFNISVPLTTLDSLQAQSQEHMSSINGVPLVKLLGVTPSGLNASSEGEIACFYDMILAEQQALYETPLKKLIDIIQLAEFGDIDDSIGVKWNPLHSLSEAEQAAARKTDAETDSIYIESGVISPVEVRERIAHAENSVYSTLDVDVMIEPIDNQLEDFTDDSVAN